MRKDYPVIDLASQQKRIRGDIDRRIQAVLDHGAYIAGPEIAMLESRLADFAGAGHCVACASGTAALDMALQARGIGPGHVVFVPAFSFFATAEAVARVGATPAMVDIDPALFCIDPAALEKAIFAVGSRDPSAYPVPLRALDADMAPAAVVAVDLFGRTADYDRLLPLAERHGLFVLEDAAQSFGSRHGDKKACGLGCGAAATSFYPSKPLGCYGDGGAAFTDDGPTAELLRSLRDHGREAGNAGRHVRIGFNARLDTIQAAVLLAKLEVFEEELEARGRVAAWYAEALAGVDGISAPRPAPGGSGSWAQYCILVEGGRRDALARHLRGRGIGTNVYYRIPLHLEPAFAELGYAPEDMPVSLAVSRTILALPFHPYLERDGVETIADAIRGFMR